MPPFLLRLLLSLAALPLDSTAPVPVEAAHLRFLPSDSLTPEERRDWSGIPIERFSRLREGQRMEFGTWAPPTLLRIDLEPPGPGRWWLVSELRTPKRIELRRGARRIGVFGDERPFAQRPVPTTDLAIPLDLGAPRETLLAMVSEPYGPCAVRLRLVPDAAFAGEAAHRATTDALVVGYMAAILLVALCLWLAVRESSFAWYAVYYAAALGWLCTKRGLGFQYLWPSLPGLNPGMSLFLAHLSVGAFAQFLRHLLELRRDHPRLDRLVLLVVAFQFAVAPLLLAHQVSGPALRLTEGIQALLPLGLLALLALRAREGHRLALRLLLAFAPLGLAMIYGTLVEFGLSAGGPSLKTAVLTVAALVENTLATLVLLQEVRSREKARVRLERDFHARLVESSDHLSRALSEDIHDGIGQRIFALRMHVYAASGSMPEDLSRLLDERIGGLHQDLRDVARRLHPPLLREGGLEQALASLCRDLAGPATATIDFDARSLPEGLPDAHATHLYRIVQESLSNALRHASARSIAVRLRSRPGGVRLEVEDDGVGLSESAFSGRGLGLRAIGSRARAMGGTAEILPRREGGTRVVVEVPVGGRTRAPARDFSRGLP